MSLSINARNMFGTLGKEIQVKFVYNIKPFWYCCFLFSDETKLFHRLTVDFGSKYMIEFAFYCLFSYKQVSK